MSDELSTAELSTAELSTVLRELAVTYATPPVVGGAEIRDRATRRRRRRRAAVTLGAGTAALALLAFALTLHLGEDPDHQAANRPPTVTRPDSAPPSEASPAPVSGTLDLPGRTLTFDGRVMPIVSDFEVPLASTSPMTVIAKQDSREVTVDVRSKSGPAVVGVPYAVELRAGEDEPLYVGAFTSELKVLSDYDVGGALIALGTEDAQWFYARVRGGDTLSVTVGARATAGASDAAREGAAD